LHDWTESEEWDNAKLQVFSYGNKNLVRCKNPTKRGMKIVRGPGSVVEDTFEAIREKNNNTIPNKIVLTGNKGSGKSGCLTHAVYHARSNGWIVVFIPRGYDHVSTLSPSTHRLTDRWC
jgi:predicted AAA+ superfamily ATPase